MVTQRSTINPVPLPEDNLNPQIVNTGLSKFGPNLTPLTTLFVKVQYEHKVIVVANGPDRV